MTPNLHGKRVLLVEDDALLLMSLEQMVTGFGCVVAGTAMNVKAALSLAERAAADLAVLDVNLQNQLVTPVAARLAQRGIPFLFATGYDALIVADFPHRPVVRKPYTDLQIRDAMLSAVAPPQL
ncbi:MAG TPA: response regulator [Reyranella sp.]|nr:response regulator [Reyranella sp.]